MIQMLAIAEPQIGFLHNVCQTNSFNIQVDAVLLKSLTAMIPLQNNQEIHKVRTLEML